MSRGNADVITIREYYRGFVEGRELGIFAKLGRFGLSVVLRLGDAEDNFRLATLPRVDTVETGWFVEGELEAERANWDPLEGPPPQK